MSGGKGKSHGGKAGPKGGDGSRQQVSHSAKAGLQVRKKTTRSFAFIWEVAHLVRLFRRWIPFWKRLRPNVEEALF